MGQQQERSSRYDVAAGFRVGASVLAPADEWHVHVAAGTPNTGEFVRYMAVDAARELAAALTAAADHYDAETARLSALEGC